MPGGGTDDLSSQVASLGWYHTIELPGGVRTPGVFDTVTGARKSLLPDSLDGMRCLDVATCNGFWAFEMEKRGAREVVAIDLAGPEEVDWPAFDPMQHKRYGNTSYDGFELAHKALGSRVDHRTVSVYDVTREALGGFDLVFVGTLLLHLRDPVRALTALRPVTDGQLVLNESISLPLTLSHPRSPAARFIGTGGSNWWVPNLAALKRMVEAAGFQVAETTRPYLLPWGSRPKWGRAPTGARVKGVVRNLGRAAGGTPHASLRATPRSG